MSDKNQSTAFFWDEKCFWHFGGNYALLAPVKGFVQPLVAGGLPEAPETKRRLKNLMDVSGLSKELDLQSAPSASLDDILRVHTTEYIDQFKQLSDQGGGELGLRTPFGPGAFEIAALSVGLVMGAVETVVEGKHKNAYALSRPPGHHCLPEWPNGFCLLANIAIAIEAAKAKNVLGRVAVVDWDVHHGNGTETIFYDRDDVLTISIHQNQCYPPDTGYTHQIGKGAGEHYNMNIPLPPGCGHETYLSVMDRLVIPRLKQFKPELVIVACGFDAAGVDPLSRMLCTAQTYRDMTKRIMDVTDGKMVAAHEGGYSELYVPFCGHSMLEQMSGSSIKVEDPLGARLAGQQPDDKLIAYQCSLIAEMEHEFGVGDK